MCKSASWWLPIRAWRVRVAREHCGQAHAEQQYLEALRRELGALGVPAEISTSGMSSRLRLGGRYISWRIDDGFENNLLAAHVSGAGWQYWWPWIQPIGPVSKPAEVARIIADELGVDCAAEAGIS